MFRELRHHLGPGRQALSSLPWAIKNAITESALLHGRQLADILLSRTNFPTDIKLKEILPGFHPTRLEELRELYGGRSGGICETLNKFAMHPSKIRNVFYDYTLVLQQLGTIIEDIVCEIERHKRSTAFDWTGGGKAAVTLKLSTSPITHVPSSQTFKP
ncbi:MAG: hypothetical protein JWN40_427 [Phycisphaerales bacterium]|nr:hypothetical protein [Phycisphaerales bacterium]